MIREIAANPKFHNVVISTGNVLGTNNKLGRKSSEELVDGLKLTLLPSQQTPPDAVDVVEVNAEQGQVLRASAELKQKLTENTRPEISIGAKIFLTKSSPAAIEQAVEALLQILKVQHVDNVVLAYHPNPSDVEPTTPATPTSATTGEFKWHSRTDQTITELKQLWAALEEFALRKQITKLGVSDLDVETLEELHRGARVPPTIAQINLSSCCVVPPPLREFCATHDIQLLTHSDPEQLLPEEQCRNILPGYALQWTLRYAVYVRCRGVLTAKGFLLGASKQKSD